MSGLNNRNARIAIASTCNLNCTYCDSSKASRTETKTGSMEDFRSTPLSCGNITTETCLKIIDMLTQAGFSGMTLTGGEPFLNKDWGVIANASHKLWMRRVGITTNGMLLARYLKKHPKLPDGLDLITISLDTTDPEAFRTITSGWKLEIVMEGLRLAKERNPHLKIRANKVLLRSEVQSIGDYIEYCEKSGVIDEINLLNLLLKEPKNKDFFEREFISAQEIMHSVLNDSRFDFSMDDKYEFRATLPSGMQVILKDTNLTLRSEACDSCEMYCQEGYYTIRVATDGTVMMCPDYTARMVPVVDGAKELQSGQLLAHVQKMAGVLIGAKQEETLQKFFKIHKVNLSYPD